MGIIFIAIQFGLVIYAKFIPERFFCWAPYDSHTKFETIVKINDQTLTPEEAASRYGYKMKGWEQRSINNVFMLIEQYEHSYGKEDQANVKMIYSTNGHPEQIWTLKP